MTFQITRPKIEHEAAWTSHYYGVTPQKALQIEASFILTGRYIEHIDSPETETWLRQFFPDTEKEASEVKESFRKLQDKMIKTDEDRALREAAYQAFAL